ncbi:unnamed protein product [Polarella glacialis]|uniref:Uncharacterized protein n=1 Tax=Polarella glacialis TaxID=89957 RepID=A0A813DVK5_POLGL|nr:unnamed protein product [Polarella glacialis]
MACSRAALVLLFALFAFSGAALADDLADEQAALAAEDACLASGEDCSLELRQLRAAKKVEFEAEAEAEAEAEESEEQAEVGGARCMDDADQKIWTNGGHAKFDKDLEFCGRQCAAGYPCTRDCMKNKVKYSPGCAGCMAGLVQCSASPNCINQCISGQTPNCNACVKAKCRPKFFACSGLAGAGGH